MTHIEYIPGAEGTGIFVLGLLKACFYKGTKQKSQMSWLRQDIGIVFEEAVLIWITTVIQYDPI
jgi:hypothetical protein